MFYVVNLQVNFNRFVFDRARARFKNQRYQQ